MSFWKTNKLKDNNKKLRNKKEWKNTEDRITENYLWRYVVVAVVVMGFKFGVGYCLWLGYGFT